MALCWEGCPLATEVEWKQPGRVVCLTPHDPVRFGIFRSFPADAGAALQSDKQLACRLRSHDTSGSVSFRGKVASWFRAVSERSTSSRVELPVSTARFPFEDSPMSLQLVVI